MVLKIGIPQALGYYAFFPFWKTFFQELGFTVIPSGLTTKGILDLGVKETVNDACVPIKVFHGHVLSLKERVDLIFVPRLVNISRDKTETFCPKFLGLPDMIRAVLPHIPLLAPTVDLRRGIMPLWTLCKNLGRKLGKGYGLIFWAFIKAQQNQRRFSSLVASGITPPEALTLDFSKGSQLQVNPVREQGSYRDGLTIALLGFPYTLYDSFISVDIIKKLRKLGVNIFTFEMIEPKLLVRQSRKLPKNLFWYFSNKVVRAALYYLDGKKIDGIIHVTAFGCGPDAMADKLIELEAKNHEKIPFLSIAIDEHTGEAGLFTRLEAFVDMLRLRRDRG